MNRLPVLLVTGFLGSGKTTLINRLLRDGSMPSTAVIVNEAGAVAIDHLLVERGSEDTVLIDGGCVCCSQRSGLAESVLGLLQRRRDGSVPPFERILVETSGLADPVPIVQTFIGDRGLARHCRLEGVVTLVDLVSGAGTLGRNPEAVSQVAMADLLLLSKEGLATAAEAAAAEAAAVGCNPQAPRRMIGEGLLGPDLLRIEEAGAGWADVATPSARHAGVAVASLSFPGALSEAALEAWLDATIGALGVNLLRLKAVLNIAGNDRPVVVQGVQHLVHAPAMLPRWPEWPPRNRALLIGRDLERDVLEDALADLAVAAGGRG